MIEVLQFYQTNIAPVFRTFDDSPGIGTGLTICVGNARSTRPTLLRCFAPLMILPV
jgi:hypothetical protein